MDGLAGSEVFDARQMAEGFTRFDRDDRDPVANLSRSLDCAGPHRILIMGGGDRAKRALFTVVCLLVIMLCVTSIVAKKSALKLQSGWVGGRAGLEPLLSAGIWASTPLPRRLVLFCSGLAIFFTASAAIAAAAIILEANLGVAGLVYRIDACQHFAVVDQDHPLPSCLTHRIER
jgi:hypothetical protein